MTIGLHNAEPVLLEAVKKHVPVVNLDRESGTNADVYFFDFIPTKSDKTPEKAARLLKQVTLLEEAVKRKKPILLFDRYLALTSKEHDWLKRSNTRFLEPALNHRTGFTYLPFWYVPKTLNDISISVSGRPYILGYKGNISERLKSFETTYVSFAKVYPSHNIVYDKPIAQTKEEEYKNDGIERKPFNYTDCQYTFIIGTNLEYRVGYLDSYLFKALDANCVPLIPLEHRYFSAISWPSNRMDFLVDQYDKVHIGMLLEVYENLERYYPEMQIQNVAESITRIVKGA